MVCTQKSNDRLTRVVEEHLILGEIQNGFRKEQCGSDNIFVLDTVMWKAKYLRKKIHMGFVDISKAYDSETEQNCGLG